MLNTVLIKVHTASLNSKDADIANSGNPWSVISAGITCNDRADDIIAVGDKVRRFSVSRYGYT